MVALAPYLERCSICGSVELRTSVRSHPPHPGGPAVGSRINGSSVSAIQVRIAMGLSMLAEAVHGRSDCCQHLSQR